MGLNEMVMWLVWLELIKQQGSAVCCRQQYVWGQDLPLQVLTL